MSKFCKECGHPNDNTLLKYCSKHIWGHQKPKKKYEIKRTPLKRSQNPINKISQTNKNISAKFSQQIIKKIIERDKLCIFCDNPIQDRHHVYFGTQANYLENRNNENQGVGLCRKHHEECHSCKIGEGKRQDAINYLLNYYK